MGAHNAMDVLLRAAQLPTAATPEDEKSARIICEALGGLPLALVQVGCYCYSSKLSFTQYLRRFECQRAKLMRAKPNLQLDAYGYSVYASVGLSYSLLETPAQSLLHLLAFFHPFSIPLEILRIAAKYEFLGDWEWLSRDEHHIERLKRLRELLIPEGEWDDIYIEELLNNLQSSSLISLSSSNNLTSITIHPLIQSCTQDTLSPPDYSLYHLMAMHTLGSCSRYTELAILRHLTQHITEVESRNVEVHVNDRAAFGYSLFSTGFYKESMRTWQKTREECCEREGPKHQSSLRATYWMGRCLRLQNRCIEAEALLRDVVDTWREVFGEDDHDAINCYYELATLLTMQAKTVEAEKMLRQVIALRTKKYGEEHRGTLSTISTLSDNLSLQKRYSEAEKLLQIHLPIMKEKLGSKNDVTLFASNYLSVALNGQGKWKEAESILQEAVTGLKEVYGKEHPYTLVALHNLSVSIYKGGDLTEAQKIQQEVLQIRVKKHGNDHSFTTQTREALMETTQAMEQLSNKYQVRNTFL